MKAHARRALSEMMFHADLALPADLARMRM